MESGPPSPQKSTSPNPRRRTSLEIRAGAENKHMLRALEQRVLDAEAQKEAAADRADAEATGDSMEPSHLTLLNTNPDERNNEQIESISTVLAQLAPVFFNALSESEQTYISRGALYHFFEQGDVIVRDEEDVGFFFVVLHGQCDIDERQVHHKETAERAHGKWRRTTKRQGDGFSHFPLVASLESYGYSARVIAPEGCSMLLISKENYVQYLRRNVERELNETINLLKSTQFFTSWSELAMTRLYFWFEKVKLNKDQDVVKQGDAADFCFILRSGKCDVLVEVKEGDDDYDPSAAIEQATSPNESPAGKRSTRQTIAGSPTPRLSLQKAVSAASEDGEGPAARKSMPAKKQVLKLAAAAAFMGDQRGHPPLRVNMRHIVTLKPGAIVGEIALFRDGAKRMSTVRTVEPTEILKLDKKTFLDLDQATLNIIAENARYNAACTKEPSERTSEDLGILRQRIGTLPNISQLSQEVQLELCRVMSYRSVNENSLLVRKNDPADCLYVIISGSASAYNTEPKARYSVDVTSLTTSDPRLKKRRPSVDSLQQMKPFEILKAGQAIGQDELLQETPIYGMSVVTNDQVELMEIARKDFDRILKADRTSEFGRTVEFLSALSIMDGISVAAIHGLSHNVSRKTYMRDQLCFAHPPDPTLGPASYSYDYVYLIFSGEARLMCGIEKRPPPLIDAPGSTFGPLLDAAPPMAAVVERHIGSSVVPVATLGPGECVFDNLLSNPAARWCLKPVTHMEVLIIPKREWADTIRINAVAELRELNKKKASFFQQHLDHTLAQTSAMHQKPLSPRKSPRQKRAGAFLKPIPMVRNAYEPTAEPASNALPEISSPRSPRKMQSPRGAIGAAPYVPPIQLGRSSHVAMMPIR